MTDTTAPLLCDNQDVMNALLAALSDPGSVTPRAPLESVTSWQRRAVIEHAAPYILATAADSDTAVRKLLERTEKALTDLQHRFDAEVARAVAAERERILALAESRKTTLTWPESDGAERGEIDVVPLAALRDLLAPRDDRAPGSDTRYVCAVPAAGNPDGICGNPVESEPCPEHRGEWQPE